MSYAPGAWTGAPAIDHIAVYSFNTKTLRDAGIDLEPADDLVADRMLEVLFFSVQRDAVEHDAFRSAYVAGTVYRDVDQSKAWGSPLEKRRRCGWQSGIGRCRDRRRWRGWHASGATALFRLGRAWSLQMVSAAGGRPCP